MMDTDRPIWGIHMGLGHGEQPIEEGFVAIGWAKVGDLSAIAPDRETFKKAFTEAYPGEKLGAVPVKAGVLYRFCCEMQAGDLVILPSKGDRMVNLGVLEGGYRYVPEDHTDHPHRRSVRWLNHLPRSDFSQSALYEIGSAITLFQVANHSEEFIAAFKGEAYKTQDVDDENVETVSREVEESTEDFIIKRLKANQTPYQFEHFVAHLLECMGYHARVTKASGDGSIDVIAHKDELGFEPPIIKVQCKQTEQQIGRPMVQQLHGAIEQGEHGLFVTLGGYSNDARVFERSKPNLRLLDGKELVELVKTHYPDFKSSYKMLLPLRQTYVPASAPSEAEE